VTKQYSQYSKEEKLRIECQFIMRSWKFCYNRRREWTIYGAKHRKCPQCKAKKWYPCVNLSDQRLGRKPKTNKWPHEDRVSWRRILDGLTKRGYYTRGLQANFRRYISEQH